MDAEFFVLAFTAAVNAKLLALDLLLIENRRPRAMFACILAGAMGTALAIGLIDVLVVHADAIKAQKKPSAAVDLAIGLVLLIVAALLMTGLLPRRAATKTEAGQQPKKQKSEKESRIVSVLREPRLGFAFGIGVLCGLPGAAYLTALHGLVTGKWSTATRVGGVLVFAVIEFLLIIVPWLFLELWPAPTAAALKRAQAWIAGHVVQFVAWICLLLGAYLTISALVRLL